MSEAHPVLYFVLLLLLSYGSIALQRTMGWAIWGTVMAAFALVLLFWKLAPL